MYFYLHTPIHVYIYMYVCMYLCAYMQVWYKGIEDCLSGYSCEVGWNASEQNQAQILQLNSKQIIYIFFWQGEGKDFKHLFYIKNKTQILKLFFVKMFFATSTQWESVWFFVTFIFSDTNDQCFKTF
jgi:hypothetical protein